MLDLLDKDFQSAVLKMFKDPEETTSKDRKLNMRTGSHQTEKNNKDTEII